MFGIDHASSTGKITSSRQFQMVKGSGFNIEKVLWIRFEANSINHELFPDLVNNHLTGNLQFGR